ncbi:MAG TPA: glutaredoxin family protein [Terriglobia bacterium]|nr:glutaredoxin family protein [Terriglobia bacterium]
MGKPQIVIYSRPGCGLCEQARKQVSALQERYEFTLREVNILQDRVTYDMFKDEIPVIFVDGKKAFKHRLDEKRFVRIMESSGRKRRAESSPAAQRSSDQLRSLERTRN